jgi:uncharacterized delta-60 repeat protein
LLDNGGLDGQLDHDFRGSGTSSFSGGCHQPLDDITGLAIGRDDSVFGIGSLQGPYKAVVAKWNSDGQIDTSFGDSGSITYALPAAWGTAGVSIAIDADNRLLAALRTDGSSGIGGAIVRFTPNGQLDSSFGTDGVVDLGTLGYGSLAGLCCIQVDSSDRILVTGIQETRPDTSGFLDQHAFAARFTNDGTPDETFGTHGFALVGNGWFFSIAALAIDEHNRPFIAGTFASPYNPDFGVGVIQLNDDGSPNTAVGFGGIFSAEFGRNHATALSVGADGRIVLASYNEVSSSALLRYDQIFGDGVD